MPATAPPAPNHRLSVSKILWDVLPFLAILASLAMLAAALLNLDALERELARAGRPLPEAFNRQRLDAIFARLPWAGAALLAATAAALACKRPLDAWFKRAWNERLLPAHELRRDLAASRLELALLALILAAALARPASLPTLALAWLFARSLNGPVAGLLAAAALALLPAPDPLFAPALLAALWTAAKLAASPHRPALWVLFAFLSVAGLSAHLFLAAPLALLALWLILEWAAAGGWSSVRAAALPLAGTAAAIAVLAALVRLPFLIYNGPPDLGINPASTSPFWLPSVPGLPDALLAAAVLAAILWRKPAPGVRVPLPLVFWLGIPALASSGILPPNPLAPALLLLLTALGAACAIAGLMRRLNPQIP